MKKINIRPYQKTDDKAILKILKETGGHYYTKNEIDFSDYQKSYVYESNDEVLGFVCLEVHERISQIICYVSPRYRKQGIGSQLFEQGKEELSNLDPNTIWLFFRNDVGNSAEFYQKRGAKPWYSYHHMMFNNQYNISDLQLFDKVINYTSEHFLTYINGRSRAFYKVNQMIDARPYDEKERSEEIKNWAKQNENNIWLFFNENRLIGSIALYEGFFDEVFVLPEYQGKGYGKAIVNWALDYCDKSGWQPSLAVVTGNKPAIHLYQSCGFKIVQTLEMNRLFSPNKEPDLRGPIGG